MAKKKQAFPVRTVNIPFLLRSREKIVQLAHEYNRENKDATYFTLLDRIIKEIHDHGFDSCLNQWRRANRQN